MPVSGSTIRFVHLYLDANDAPLTGQTSPANITFQLMRDSGSGMVAASETVSFAETATLGYYNISFTPVNSGTYTLFIQELAGGKRQPRYDFQVSAAGAVYAPAFSGAFCSLSDMQRWTQTTISPSTNPTDTDAAGFAQNRANILMALTAGWGYSITPGTVPFGSRVQSLLREANCIGAALDYTLAQQFRQSPSLSDRPRLLQEMWNQYVGREGAPGSPMAHIPGYLEIEVKMNLSSLATDYILSGDTLPPDDVDAPQALPIMVGIGDTY